MSLYLPRHGLSPPLSALSTAARLQQRPSQQNRLKQKRRKSTRFYG